MTDSNKTSKNISGDSSKNILVISIHPVLEFDEVSLFEKLGFNVFSLGFYTDRDVQVKMSIADQHTMRRSLVNSEWHKMLQMAGGQGKFGRLENDPADWFVTEEFMENFDTIVVHHNFRFIIKNWDAISKKRVIWRTIGQELEAAEQAMRPYREKGLEIVRWAEAETEIPGYIGGDVVIRASKDPREWMGWTGHEARFVTFNNDFVQRADGLNYAFYQKCTENGPFDLFGLRNNGIKNWKGVATHKEQIDILRKYRGCFVTGTYPAPYTLGFIESWMVGIPVIHVGRKQFLQGKPGIFEVDRMIVHGETGFLVNTPEEAQGVFKELLSDHELAKKISAGGRAAAIKWFGLDVALDRWKHFLLGA